MYAGIVLTFAAGGFNCSALGWPALFYIPGGISLVWLALWTALVADSPEKHSFISAAERDYILLSQGRSARREVQLATSPQSEVARLRAGLRLLRDVVTSPCVLALYVANVAFDYGGSTFLTNIPNFMNEVRVPTCVYTGAAGTVVIKCVYSI